MSSSQPETTVTLAQLLDTAVAHHHRDELEEAEKLYIAFLSRAPENPHGWTNLGALRRKQGAFGAAIAAHLRALEIEPDMLNALNNLANAYNDAGDYSAAIPVRERLLAEKPDDLGCLRDLAVSLRGDRQHARVIELVDAAETKQDLSGEGELILQRALSHLMLGNYSAGFRDFEGRYGGNEVSLPKDVPFPRWMGEDIEGKEILVIPEQGFGDAILMCRFLPRLMARCARVTMIVKPPLQRLLEGLEARHDGKLRLVSHARKSDPFDFYTPNMSLPDLVGMEDDGMPPAPPPLEIPERARTRARSIIGPFDGRFKIGIVWTGSLSYKANHRRSCGPDAFLRLTRIPGVQLFSLYKGEAHDTFVSSGLQGLVVDACATDQDFADTAAIIGEMDLMITTDTAVVHIAGSMGKPVWNMLSHEGFWLYGLGETTPWYPSMRLFHQSTPGDWAGVFDRVGEALIAHLADRS